MNIFIDGTWNTPKDKSNIWHMHQKYGGKYFSGPGTKAFFLDRILGGVFGYGTQNIVDEAYQYILKAHRNQQLNIFGFSRGAAAARMLAGKWCKEGGSVNFLGAFDTVGAFGIPIDIFGIPFQNINLFHDMDVHPNVKTASHAQALDEKRPAFVGTPMEPREGITQQGFSGDHWRIGSSDETFHWMCEQFENV